MRNLEEVIRKGQERFKKDEAKRVILTIEHQKSIEKLCLFFGGIFIGIMIGLIL